MNQRNYEPIFVVECFDCNYTEEVPISEITHYLRCHCGSANVQWYPLDYAIVHESDDFFDEESFESLDSP